MRGVSMARGKRPNWMIEIAQERMDILFNRAEKEYKEHPERSHRYVELARKISKKYNAKIPQAWGRRYCKNCYKFLVPGHNCAVRLINNEINIYCGECGHIMKIPYIREKKLKRRAKIDSYTFKKRDYE
jgi:ribonuclease P protein subunit RPR2